MLAGLGTEAVHYALGKNKKKISHFSAHSNLMFHVLSPHLLTDYIWHDEAPYRIFRATLTEIVSASRFLHPLALFNNLHFRSVVIVFMMSSNRYWRGLHRVFKS